MGKAFPNIKKSIYCMGKTPPYIAPIYKQKKRFWQRALGAHIWEFPYMGPIYEQKKGPYLSHYLLDFYITVSIFILHNLLLLDSISFLLDSKSTFIRQSRAKHFGYPPFFDHKSATKPLQSHKIIWFEYKNEIHQKIRGCVNNNKHETLFENSHPKKKKISSII